MFKGRHFDRSVILLCVRWYLAYSLSLRDLKEMMAERGVSVDHATIYRWTFTMLRSCSSNSIGASDPSLADGMWMKRISKSVGVGCTLYRAIDSNGDTVEFCFSERRNLTAAKRFLRKALQRHGRPERIVIDGSQTNPRGDPGLRCGKPAPGRIKAQAEADPDPAKCLPQ